MILTLDTETKSSADLARCGAHKYVEDKDFAVLLLAYGFDDEPLKLIDLTEGEEIPQEFIDAYTDPRVEKWAHNSAFDRIVLDKWLGLTSPLESWWDDMVLCSICGLPMSLGAAGAALGVPEDKAKDREGKALIRWFCKPCKPTKTRPDQTWHRPEDYPEKWARFKSYCLRDVVAERAIHDALSRWTPIPIEHDAWVLDQRINDKGVHVDRKLALAAVAMDARYKAELTEQAVALTGIENPNSVAQVKDWLAEQEGQEFPSLNKKVIADVVASLNTEKAKQFMAIRSELAKSSTKKYDAMTRSACADDHIRGCFQFCGAGRTGRWAGRLVQLQNLSKNKMPDLAECRALVREGDLDCVKLLYGNVTGCLSELVRTALIPEKGHRFIVCDYSAIESRVLNWIAGEEWVMEEFRGDGLIYEATGSKMFGYPKHSIAKGGEHHDLRAAAKVAELACIAEGSLVVTDEGPVPIEQVTTDMRVWDGTEWVAHQGLLYKGLRPTVRVGGVELTADHKILTEKGMVPCGESEGLNWADVRVPDCDSTGARACARKRQAHKNGDMPLHMRDRKRDCSGASATEREADAVVRVQGRRTGCKGTHNAWTDRQRPVQRLERNAAAMHKPERPELAALREPGHRGLSAVAGQLRRIFGRHGGYIPGGTATRPKGQRGCVQPRELPVGHEVGKRTKQAQQPTGHGLWRDGYGRRTGGTRASEIRDYVEPRKAREPVVVRGGRSSVPVYDLLNAGPRHRFCIYDPAAKALRCVSNCGYGGGMGAMKAFGADKMGMSDEDIINAVDLWRGAHPNVVKLWKALERAAIRCVVHGTAQVSTIGNIRFEMEKGILWMTLPSGRRIAYFGIRYAQGTGRYTSSKKILSYMGQDQQTRKWVRMETYGPKMTENLVQATARDCLRDAMLALDKAGFDIRAHIHDEVILTEPIGGRTLQEVASIMGQTPAWATGLPLRGDGYECDFYMKD